MSLKAIQNLERAVKRLVQAEVAYSWRGGSQPDDWREIQIDLDRARRLYRAAINRLKEEQL